MQVRPGCPAAAALHAEVLAGIPGAGDGGQPSQQLGQCRGDDALIAPIRLRCSRSAAPSESKSLIIAQVRCRGCRRSPAPPLRRPRPPMGDGGKSRPPVFAPAPPVG